jgi:hypothetical protein
MEGRFWRPHPDLDRSATPALPPGGGRPLCGGSLPLLAAAPGCFGGAPQTISPGAEPPEPPRSRACAGRGGGRALGGEEGVRRAGRRACAGRGGGRAQGAEEGVRRARRRACAGRGGGRAQGGEEGVRRAGRRACAGRYGRRALGTRDGACSVRGTACAGRGGRCCHVGWAGPLAAVLGDFTCSASQIQPARSGPSGDKWLVCHAGPLLAEPLMPELWLMVASVWGS